MSCSFLKNPKDLDPSFKMDLDFWDCFGSRSLGLLWKRNFLDLRTNKVLCYISEYCNFAKFDSGFHRYLTPKPLR